MVGDRREAVGDRRAAVGGRRRTQVSLTPMVLTESGSVASGMVDKERAFLNNSVS